MPLCLVMLPRLPPAISSGGTRPFYHHAAEDLDAMALDSLRARGRLNSLSLPAGIRLKLTVKTMGKI